METCEGMGRKEGGGGSGQWEVGRSPCGERNRCSSAKGALHPTVPLHAHITTAAITLTSVAVNTIHTTSHHTTSNSPTPSLVWSCQRLSTSCAALRLARRRRRPPTKRAARRSGSSTPASRSWRPCTRKSHARFASSRRQTRISKVGPPVSIHAR